MEVEEAASEECKTERERNDGKFPVKNGWI